MKDLEKKVGNSVEMFLLAAKECGFTTAKEIEDNIELVAIVAKELVEKSREKILTKRMTDPMFTEWIASRYQQKVLNQ